MQTSSSLLGKKIRFQTSHSDGSIIIYSARVVKVYNATQVWVEIPARVRALPFPPLHGKRYGLFNVADIIKSVA